MLQQLPRGLRPCLSQNPSTLPARTTCHSSASANSAQCLKQPHSSFASVQHIWQTPAPQGSRLVVSAAETDTMTYGADLSTPKDGYLVLGVAHCFEKNEDGKLVDIFVVEPISANSLESMVAGAKTCFKHVTGLSLGDALKRDRTLLPAEFSDAVFCEDYEFRCEACARTWLRPHAQDNLMDLVPLGVVKSKYNYSLSEKRVLNFENVVNDDDNIKQDLSIDVYGRAKDEDDGGPDAESDQAAAAEEEGKEEEEEDELDSLLA